MDPLIKCRASGVLLSWFTYTCTAEHYPERITYQDGRYREYGYDDAHQLTSETHKTGARHGNLDT